MAFCPSCGSPAEGSYCAKCGARVGPSAPGTGASSGPGPATGLADNVVCALCYVLGLVTGILFLVIEPYSRNRAVRFHAFQSIFLNIAVIAVWYVWTFLAMISGGFLFLLSPLIGLGIVAVWVFMVVKAYQGQKLVLPVIGPLAEKQAAG